MKIIREGYAYIQLEDINYLAGKDNIPTEILNIIVETNEYTKHHFTKTEDKKAINYIGSSKCILDYDELTKKSNKDLVALLEQLNQEIDSNKAISDKEESARKAKLYYEKGSDLIYARYQVEEFMRYKQGLVEDIEFPEDVKPPKKSKKNIFSMFINKIKKGE